MTQNKQLDSPAQGQIRVQFCGETRSENSKGFGEQLKAWVENLMPARF